LKITRPLDRRLRVELDKDAENVHVFDTSPAVQDLEWLLPWRENLRRLLVLDFSITSVDAVNDFVALEALSLSPSAQVQDWSVSWSRAHGHVRCPKSRTTRH